MEYLASAAIDTTSKGFSVENLGAMGVIAVACILGLRWILVHTSNLAKQNHEVLTELVAANHKLLGELKEVLRENTRVIRDVIQKCEMCNPQQPREKDR